MSTHPPSPPTAWVIQHSPDSATQAQSLAQAIAEQLRQAIATRGQATLAVSGGKSPLALFAALRAQPLAWAQVSVLLVDERCVPSTHADSNSHLVATHLLQEQAATAHWLPFFDDLANIPSGSDDSTTLDTLVRAANQRLHAIAWPLDVVVLGMGEDGHTASLFPGAAGLLQALNSSEPVAWVCPNTAPHARLTLTLATLLAAKHVHLPLAGARKHGVFVQACASMDTNLPISLVLHQHHLPHPVQVWLAP